MNIVFIRNRKVRLSILYNLELYVYEFQKKPPLNTSLEAFFTIQGDGKMKKNKLLYFLMVVLFILSIMSLANSMRSKRIVEVLNRYHEIDKIVISKDDNKYEIIGFDLEKYKDALEPRNIVSKKNGKEITVKVENKIIDIEYYIENQKIIRVLYILFE